MRQGSALDKAENPLLVAQTQIPYPNTIFLWVLPGQRKADLSRLVSKRVFIQNEDVHMTPQSLNTTVHQSRQPREWEQLVLPPLTFEVIWCWILPLITHCSVSCGLMYTSFLLGYPQQTFSQSLWFLPSSPSSILYLSGPHHFCYHPQFSNFATWLPIPSLLLTSPGYLATSFHYPQPVHLSTSHLSTFAFRFHYSSPINLEVPVNHFPCNNASCLLSGSQMYSLLFQGCA